MGFSPCRKSGTCQRRPDGLRGGCPFSKECPTGPPHSHVPAGAAMPSCRGLTRATLRASAGCRPTSAQLGGGINVGVCPGRRRPTPELQGESIQAAPGTGAVIPCDPPQEGFQPHDTGRRTPGTPRHSHDFRVLSVPRQATHREPTQPSLPAPDQSEAPGRRQAGHERPACPAPEHSRTWPLRPRPEAAAAASARMQATFEPNSCGKSRELDTFRVGTDTFAHISAVSPGLAAVKPHTAALRHCGQ